MTFVSFALALVKFLGLLVGYLHDQKLISAGEAMAVADALREQADAVKRAGEARARSDHSVDSDGVFHTDKDERPE